MPVVTAGVMPSSTTLRTSTPSGVPALSKAGILNRLDRPAQTAASRAVRPAASRRSPPSSWATAGEPAAAAAPSPDSSRTALSPMSLALVSAPWPG